MGVRVDDMNAEIFSSRLLAEWQARGMLRTTTMHENIVNADTKHWNKLEEFALTEVHAPGQDLTPIVEEMSRPTAVLKKYKGIVYSDEQWDKTLPFETVANYSRNWAPAVGRQYDDALLKAITAGGDFPNAAVAANGDNQGTGALTERKGGFLKANGAGFVRSLLDRSFTRLAAMSVPQGNICAVIPATWMVDIRNDEKMTNGGDYVEHKPLPHGERVFQWGGMKVLTKPLNLTVGGLPADTGYVYHYESIGMIEQMRSSQVSWSASKDSWAITARISVGGVVIRPEGVIKITKAA